MPRYFEIGLVWHSVRSGNLGVGALSVGNIALARRAAERAGLTPKFTVIGPREPGPVYISGPDISAREITGRYMASPGGYWADLGHLDYVLDIGAGDSFADIYPDKRFAYIMATKAMAIARGVPMILSPQTIGPFSRQPHSAAAAWACTRAQAVFARDPLSMAALAKLAPHAKAFQAVDVAFALPFERQPKSTGKPRVGINVSGLLFSGGYTGKNEFGIEVDYAALTRGLVAALLARGDVEVMLFGHVNSPLPNDDDGVAVDALAREFPGATKVAPFTSPSEAKSFISGLDFVVGARMHATIAAYSSGVPVVPVSYSRKFEGLFGGLGYDWMVPVRGLTTDAAIAYVLNAYERRAELAADIARGSAIVEAGLETYVAELTRCFTAAAARR